MENLPPGIIIEAKTVHSGSMSFQLKCPFHLMKGARFIKHYLPNFNIWRETWSKLLMSLVTSFHGQS